VRKDQSQLKVDNIKEVKAMPGNLKANLGN